MQEIESQKTGQLSNQEQEPSIYDLILSDLAKGVWSSGDRLVPTTLAKRYGTSVNPIREALQKLQGEGFVTIAPNSGARVTKFEFHAMRDVYEILQLLEPYLITWFVNEHSQEQLIDLKLVLDEMRSLNPSDFVRYRELDAIFHSLMYRQHYNKRALALWQKNRLMLQAFHNNLAFSSKRFSQSLAEHELIIKGIEEHDLEKVLEVLNKHIDNSGDYWTLHAR